MSRRRCDSCQGRCFTPDGPCHECCGTGDDLSVASDLSNVGLIVLVLCAIAIVSVWVAAAGGMQ